jgi:hypothetical protein
MLFAAIGPMIAMFDPFGGNDEGAADTNLSDLDIGPEDPQSASGTEEGNTFIGAADRSSVLNGLSGDESDTLSGGFGSDSLY